jgi:C-terminal processing protease CtpA/Prc
LGVRSASVRARDGHPVVASVQKGMSAEKAGLQAGHVILSVDGRDTRELGQGALRYLLAGKPGTSVSVEAKTAAEKPRNLIVTRFDPETVRR